MSKEAANNGKGAAKDAVAEMTNWAQRVDRELQSAKKWEEDYNDLFFAESHPKTNEQKIAKLKNDLEKVNNLGIKALPTTNSEYGLGKPFSNVGVKRHGIPHDPTLKAAT